MKTSYFSSFVLGRKLRACVEIFAIFLMALGILSFLGSCTPLLPWQCIPLGTVFTLIGFRTLLAVAEDDSAAFHS
jgi:hypothetical protein